MCLTRQIISIRKSLLFLPIILSIVMLLCALPAKGAVETLTFNFHHRHPLHTYAFNALQVAYSSIGIEIQRKELPPIRSITALEENTIDGLLIRGESVRSQSDLIEVPIALAEGEIVVFTKNVEFEVKGWESLRPYFIGIQRGVIQVERGTLGMKTHQVSELELALHMLSLGRLDIVVIPRLPGIRGLKNTGRTDLKMLSPPVQVEKLYHYLHKKHAHLLPQITLALAKLKESGELKKLREQAEMDFINR